MTIPIYSAPNDEASVEPSVGGVGLQIVLTVAFHDAHHLSSKS